MSLMFPALTGGFLTTEPPGQPKRILLPKIGRMYLEQCSSTGDPVALQGTFGRARRYFCLSQVVGGVLLASSVVETRDAAKYPIMSRKAPQNKELYGKKC